jgi:hypothetical protein
MPTTMSVNTGAIVCGPKNSPVVPIAWKSTAEPVTTAIISTPPMEGVPSLTMCEPGPWVRMRLPKPKRRRTTMNGGIRMTTSANASRIAWTSGAAILTPPVPACAVRFPRAPG